MAETILPLQAAVRAAIVGDTSLGALIADRAYDRVPARPVFPYVTIGGLQATEDGADCVDGEEVFLDVHVWSRAKDSVEAKRIAAELKRLFHGSELDLGDGAALTDLEWRGTRFLNDPDGQTEHGVVSFVGLTEGA